MAMERIRTFGTTSAPRSRKLGTLVRLGRDRTCLVERGRVLVASPTLAARVLTGSRTSARAAYTAVAFTATPVPTARELHILNRMGCGHTPAALRELRAAGS